MASARALPTPPNPVLTDHPDVHKSSPFARTQAQRDITPSLSQQKRRQRRRAVEGFLSSTTGDGKAGHSTGGDRATTKHNGIAVSAIL